jgi:hypothetical protein
MGISILRAGGNGKKFEDRMGMGMLSREWEGIVKKKAFPHTSTTVHWPIIKHGGFTEPHVI